MFTVLSVKDEFNGKWYRKLFRNKLNVENKNISGVVVKHITYKNRNGSINWKKLDLLIGNQRNHLVCSEEILLPKEKGYKRFDDNEFKIRLASNMFIYILSQVNDKDLKVALYDVKGQYTDILPHIVKYISNPVVITDNLTAFNYITESVYNEQGATVQLTNNRSHLLKCDFLLAPAEIKEVLPLASNVIILSGEKPLTCAGGIVYYDYYFKMPEQWKAEKPDELSEQYFCGALYSKGGQYELGSIIPTVCKNDIYTQTDVSICDYLKNTNK